MIKKKKLYKLVLQPVEIETPVSRAAELHDTAFRAEVSTILYAFSELGVTKPQLKHVLASVQRHPHLHLHLNVHYTRSMSLNAS